MNDFHTKFEKVSTLKDYIVREFPDIVPKHSFDVGYFDNYNKVWLSKNEDLEAMYHDKPSKTEITLWCDGVVTREEADNAVEQTVKEE